MGQGSNTLCVGRTTYVFVLYQSKIPHRWKHSSGQWNVISQTHSEFLVNQRKDDKYLNYGARHTCRKGACWGVFVATVTNSWQQGGGVYGRRYQTGSRSCNVELRSTHEPIFSGGFSSAAAGGDEMKHCCHVSLWGESWGHTSKPLCSSQLYPKVTAHLVKDTMCCWCLSSGARQEALPGRSSPQGDADTCQYL